MAIFIVSAEKPNDELGQAIVAQFPTDHYKISSTQWLVSADTVSKSLAEQLEIRGGKFGRAIVMRTDGSGSGYHVRSLWEWLSQKRETNG